MENCEAMTSSPHSFAYSYWLVKKCLLKICETSKCHNFLIFQPIFIRFSLLCLKNFTLSSEIKLNLLWSSSLKLHALVKHIYHKQIQHQICYEVQHKENRWWHFALNTSWSMQKSDTETERGGTAAENSHGHLKKIRDWMISTITEHYLHSVLHHQQLVGRHHSRKQNDYLQVNERTHTECQALKSTQETWLVSCNEFSALHYFSLM